MIITPQVWNEVIERGKLIGAADVGYLENYIVGPIFIKTKLTAVEKDVVLTMERAAEEAGVSLREMMDYLRQKKIAMQYDLEDFERDLKGIYQRL